MVQPIFETTVERLPVRVYRSNADLGAAAAAEASVVIRQAVAARGEANLILATGNSQLTFLAALRQDQTIPWSSVNIFHMDEYVGLDPTHPASFPLFLRRRLIDFITPKAFYPVRGVGISAEAMCDEYEALLRARPTDLTAMGIGENGHLAFNDPPYARFDDPRWVKIIELAEASRRQQVGEGHFRSLDEVPTHAITVTIPALLAARHALVIVPEGRKAPAVEAALRGPVTEDCPASILRHQAHARLFLDPASASRAFPDLR